MKVAFAGCANIDEFATQVGWAKLQALMDAESVLVLLGDVVYSDGQSTSCILTGCTKKLKPPAYRANLETKYQRQWAETNFAKLWQSVPPGKRFGIWQ